MKFQDIPVTSINIKEVLKAELDHLEDISAVQIGAGCGGWEKPKMGIQSPHINDPVWELFKSHASWKVYLFEPVVSEFVELVEFYKDCKNVTTFNACVVPHMYSRYEALYIRKSKSMSSIDPFHRKLDQYAEVVELKTCLSIGIEDVAHALDLNPYFLQIDTEGLDCKLILKLERFENIKLLSFEWIHADEEEIQKVYNKLKFHGFELIFKSHFDVVFKKIK